MSRANSFTIQVELVRVVVALVQQIVSGDAIARVRDDGVQALHQLVQGRGLGLRDLRLAFLRIHGGRQSLRCFAGPHSPASAGCAAINACARDLPDRPAFLVGPEGRALEKGGKGGQCVVRQGDRDRIGRRIGQASPRRYRPAVCRRPV